MASPDKTPHDCHWTEIAALQSERADKAEAEVVRLQEALYQEQLEHYRNGRNEQGDAIARVLVASADRPPTP